VFDVLPKWTAFAIVLVSTAVYRRELLRQVDYALLATFVCFFVFVGNLGRIEAVSGLLGSVIAGRELEVSILASQVISNVPAALMLSGFTENGKALLLGVNIGGLGTPVASLASLISMKLYSHSENASLGAFMKCFLAVNFVLLIILSAVAVILI
jgi:Na+/H+ antiporter NhaD/arsenite permease-like protein